MNIFFLDFNPVVCAQYHVDTHVIKMYTEAMQMLSTAHHLIDGYSENIPCKPISNPNHPCAIWTRESIENYMWLVKLAFALREEYTFRYNKVRPTSWQVEWFDEFHPNISKWDFTDPVMGFRDFPDCIVPNDPVESYRNYYRGPKRKQLEKNGYVKWTNRKKPEWF